jgi:hypothetical protein
MNIKHKIMPYLPQFLTTTVMLSFEKKKFQDKFWKIIKEGELLSEKDLVIISLGI